MPLVACVRRRITPFFMAMAPAAELASEMISGSWTARILSVLHASKGRPSSVSAGSSQRRRVCEFIRRRVLVSGVRALESHVQPHRPVGRRRHGLEVAHDAGGALEVVGLGAGAGGAGALPPVAT